MVTSLDPSLRSHTAMGKRPSPPSTTAGADSALRTERKPSSTISDPKPRQADQLPRRDAPAPPPVPPPLPAPPIRPEAKSAMLRPGIPADTTPRAVPQKGPGAPSNEQCAPNQNGGAAEQSPRRDVAAAPNVPTPAIRSDIKSEVLLGAASPDLFRLNAFRITGLAVDATASQVTRQVEKLSLGGKVCARRLREAASNSAFALDPPPDCRTICGRGRIATSA